MRASKKMLATSALATGALVTTGIGVATAASAPSSHTVKFLASPLTHHNFGKTGHFILTEKDTTDGKYIGNDVLDAKYNAKTDGLRGTVTVALEGGTLTAKFSSKGNGPIHGTIIGGTNKYDGVTGTMLGTSAPHRSENVTLVYS